MEDFVGCFVQICNRTCVDYETDKEFEGKTYRMAAKGFKEIFSTKLMKTY